MTGVLPRPLILCAPELSRIRREIEIEWPLSDEQRRRLIEIADRCPVHADGNPYGVSHVTGGNNDAPLTDVQFAALEQLAQRWCGWRAS
jgi:hypothetical protein